jgi:hypothetical protein
MEDEILKANLLSLAGSGFLILITGILFYVFRSEVSKNIRFLLPIPPLGVAAYVFVFNMYNHYGGNLPEKPWGMVKEIMLSVAVASFIFATFTILLILFTSLFRRVI